MKLSTDQLLLVIVQKDLEIIQLREAAEKLTADLDKLRKEQTQTKKADVQADDGKTAA